MNILLIERVVTRCTDPDSPQYKLATHMSSKLVARYVSDVVPRKGEIIFVDENTSYEVVQVIYQRLGSSLPGKATFSVHIEVKPYVCIHKYVDTENQFFETWPLVINLPSDPNFFKTYTGEISDD